MALPVTISGSGVSNQNSYFGPFKSSTGGSFYTILGVTGAGSGDVGVFKATDPTSSFSEQDTGNRPNFPNTTPIKSIWVFQVGDNLHVCGQGGNSDVFYSRFLTDDGSGSEDTWVDVDTGDKDILIDTTGTAQQAEACTIAVRSGGDIIVVYQGDSDMLMGTDFARVDWNKSTAASNGAVWAGPVSIDNGGKVDWTGCVIVPGKDDRVHVFFKDDTNNDAYQRRINSDDSLETFPSSFDDTTSTPAYIFALGVSYDDGGTQRVRCPYLDSSGKVSIAKLDSADTPTVTEDVDVSDNSVFSKNESTVAGLTVDVKNLQLLYVNSGDGDLYRDTNDDDAGWGTDTEELDAPGTINHISPNVYDRSGKKLAYIYLDGSTVKYNEIVLAAGNVNVLANVDALTLAEPQATVNAETNVQAAVDALTLTENSATVQLLINIAAGVDALTLTEQAATVNAETNVQAGVDALALAEFQASVTLGGADVNVLANTDALTLTENQATVNAGTNVQAIVDALALTENQAAVNAETNVNASVDTLALTENQATIVFDVNVLATTDALTLTENQATVNAETNVQAAVHPLTLTENQASAQLNKFVSAGVDVLALATFQAGVNAETNVQGTTDNLVLAAQQSSIAFDRNVQAVVDALALTTKQAEISLDIDIQAAVDALALTENAASIALNVFVAAGVDVLTLAEFAATVEGTPLIWTPVAAASATWTPKAAASSIWTPETPASTTWTEE